MSALVLPVIAKVMQGSGSCRRLTDRFRHGVCIYRCPSGTCLVELGTPPSTMFGTGAPIWRLFITASEMSPVVLSHMVDMPPLLMSDMYSGCTLQICRVTGCWHTKVEAQSAMAEVPTIAALYYLKWSIGPGVEGSRISVVIVHGLRLSQAGST